MQSLFEEFFNKVSKFMNYMKWSPLKILIKIFFYGIIVVLFIWIIYTKKYLWLLILLGLVILGEIAHFLRKWRESKISKEESK